MNGSTISKAPIALADFQKRWIDVRNYGGKNVVYDALAGTIMKKSEFCKGHVQPVLMPDGTLKQLAKLMTPEYQANRTIVDCLLFDPSLPPGLGQNTDGRAYFNIWRGLDIAKYQPITNPQQKCPKIFQYFGDVLGQNGQGDFNYLVWSLAWNIQNPDKKPCVAIVLTGGKGSGKSTFSIICEKIFKPYSLIVESAHLVFGQFNGQLENILFVGLEEAFWARDGKQEDRAKHLITSDKITNERKGVDATGIRSFHRFVSTTNHEHAVPATLDERRYAVFEINKVASWVNLDWQELYTEINGEGLIAFYQWLRTWDLRNWHPAHNVPANNALSRQKIKSLGVSVDGFLLSCIQNESLPLLPGNMKSILDWGTIPIALDKPQQDAFLAAANQWRNSQYVGRFETPWTWQKLVTGLKKLGASKTRTNANTVIIWTISDYTTSINNFASALGVPVSALKS